jgi:tellurite resistance protein TerC
VLFWGILGALVMRGLFIAAGTALLARFHVVTYIFGGVLVVSGAKLLFSKSDHDVHPDKNIAVRLFRRLVPVTKEFHDHHFLVKEAGRWMATPLLVVLVALEASDIIFAVDSVPAVLAVSDDVFIVYTSNIFAILGLRSLYFVVAGALRRFHLLKYGLSLVLVFVGAKMIAGHWFKVPILVSLAVIASLIGAAVVASLVWPASEPTKA